jgi:hypothetical protein
LHITVETAPASDGWGLVGRIMVADHESYRTFQAFPTPSEALTFAQQLVGDMLGVFLAGQEWRRLGEDLGHNPRRQDLQFGLSHHAADVKESPDACTGMLASGSRRDACPSLPAPLPAAP